MFDIMARNLLSACMYICLMGDHYKYNIDIDISEHFHIWIFQLQPMYDIIARNLPNACIFV